MVDIREPSNLILTWIRSRVILRTEAKFRVNSDSRFKGRLYRYNLERYRYCFITDQNTEAHENYRFLEKGPSVANGSEKNTISV